MGGEFQKKITVPSPPKVAGKPHIKWDDVNLVYANGLVVLSSFNEVFSLPLGRLSEIVKEAHGKNWYWRLDPNAVPEAIRNRFFSTIQSQLGIRFQKHDQEDDRAFLIRRTTGEVYLSLVNSLIFETKEVVACTSWPTDDAPFRSHFEIQAKPDTRLATLIETLGSAERSIEILSDQENIGTINGNVTIPAEAQPILNAILKRAVADDSGVYRLLSETINTGQLEFTAGLGQAEDGMPILIGMGRL